MSSTNKTNILKLNQYQGLDKPSYLDYNADMSKIDEAMLGWYPISATVVYISDSSVKASSDLTGSISKGMKIKLTQDSVTKYFIVVGSVLQNNDTIITLDGSNTYVLTNSGITQPFFSTQEAPLGFPVNNINDMFNPKYVSNGTDFNNLRTSGWYIQGLNVNCSNNINMPIKEAFIMQVSCIGTDLVAGTSLQRLTTYVGTVYQRTYNGAWSPWEVHGVGGRDFQGGMYKHKPMAGLTTGDTYTGYFHVDTGIPAGSLAMCRMRLKGYMYAAAKPMDITVVWYDYIPVQNSIIQCGYSGPTMRSVKVGKLSNGRIGVEISPHDTLYYLHVLVDEIWASTDDCDTSLISITPGEVALTGVANAIHFT